MYIIRISFKRVNCIDTESLFSSDKFAMAGTVFSGNDSKGMIFDLIRINDGESRDLSSYVFELHSEEPSIGVVLKALDLDENKGWIENKADILKAAEGISTAVKFIPGYGLSISSIIDTAATVIPPIIDKFVEWDNDDEIIDYKHVFDFVPLSLDKQTIPVTFNARYGNELSSIGFSNSNYSVEFEVECIWEASFGPSITIDEDAMSTFRAINVKATEAGFKGGYPNFYKAIYGINTYYGSINFLESNCLFRDIPINELGNPQLNDFAQRMKAVQDYAVKNGFVGGFPTYFIADYHHGIVCGTILLNSNQAEWRDIPYGQIDLKDIGARFRATHDYAIKNGFRGGFPNFYHADYPTGRVGGSILIKLGAAEWRDDLMLEGVR
ncbi:hypothetical protein [Paenibacillus sp. ATY16]|uniref:hypothetical protein n=1 Tax=Paenibacillus sp. ATY16 TaxID=1759312 RepID=UPI00200BF415|nr:hypothetical protein [Paenibacillus sp. ATY16]MCK9861354.1 hypothetical protein [Paenibacillus sp. ATY16]